MCKPGLFGVMVVTRLTSDPATKYDMSDYHRSAPIIFYQTQILLLADFTFQFSPDPLIGSPYPSCNGTVLSIP